MRKNALIICCFTCAAGAIGAFCRWLQNQIAFDSAGLSKNSPWNYFVALVLVAAALCFWFFVRKYSDSGLVMEKDFYSVFRGSTRFFVTGAWLIGAAMIFGGLILIATMGDDLPQVLYRAIAILGILSGVAFPLMATGSEKRLSPGLNSLFATVPVLLFCLWLITSYKQNSTNPTVWAYAVEILAAAGSLLAFFYCAGYPYGRARPRSSLYFSMLGAFLCVVTLADDRGFGLQLMFFSAAAMQLFWAWMIVSNMHNPEPETETDTNTEPAFSAGGEAAPAAPDSTSVDRILDEFHEDEQKL